MISHPERSEIHLEGVLHALSDPLRLRIVRELAEAGAERRCGSFEHAVTKSTMTHHFKVLREAGLIRQRQEATLRLTSLRREDLDPVYGAGIRPAASTRSSPRRSMRSARIVPPSVAARPQLSWTLSTPSRVQ